MDKDKVLKNKAEELLSEDKIKQCIDFIIAAIKEIMEQPIENAAFSVVGNGNIRSYDKKYILEELKADLIVLSANINRIENSFNLGLIDFETNSKERNRVIRAILTNLSGTSFSIVRGTDLNPPIHPVNGSSWDIHIENLNLLFKQVGELAEVLEKEH